MGTEGTADGMRRWPPELQCATGALGPDRHLQHGAAGGRQQLLAGPLEAEGLRRPAVVQVIRPTHLWARRHVGEGAPKTVSHPDRGGGSCAGKAGGGGSESRLCPHPKQQLAHLGHPVRVFRPFGDHLPVHLISGRGPQVWVAQAP